MSCGRRAKRDINTAVRSSVGVSLESEELVGVGVEEFARCYKIDG